MGSGWRIGVDLSLDGILFIPNIGISSFNKKASSVMRRRQPVLPAPSFHCSRTHRGVSIIRCWRAPDTVSALQDIGFPHMSYQLPNQRSLRRERALRGQVGYDLNQHIRLVRNKNASLRGEAF
jgi:hypothetical protein